MNANSSLLTTKLFVPISGRHIIRRPRLEERLKQGCTGALTVICAPAGFGKTTLLSEWLHHNPLPVAWVSLDPQDNDPAQFLAYWVAALQKVQPGIGVRTLEQLQSPQPIPFESLLIDILNDLATTATEMKMVFDDYHCIENSQIHHLLTFFLDHMPPACHICLTTRSDPPFPLARLRGRGMLTEIRAKDLAFTNEEAAKLYASLGHALSAHDVALLKSRTEGWIAGLQLAAISMQGKRDISSFVSAFTGSSRYVMDYLVEEVFSGQSGTMQQFLMQTSILNRMNGALCNAVTDQQNGREYLERLDQANLFIIPLDDHREWYRYHHLFAELLQNRLQQTSPDQMKELHQRASIGYEQQGLIPEAIEHALKAEDFTRAEELISQIAEQLWFRAEQGILLKWISALPKHRGTVNPELYVILGKCIALDGRFDEAESYLRVAENHLPDADTQFQGMIAAVRAYISDYRGDIVSAEHYGHFALSTLTDDHAVWRCLASLALGDVHVQKGPLKPATDSYKEAIRSGSIADDNYCISLAQHRLVVMYQRRGQLRKAVRLIEQYLSEERLVKNKSGALSLIYGELLYELNRLPEAAEQVQTSIRVCRYQHHAAAIPYCKMCLARIHLAQGDMQEASRETEESVRLLQQSDIPPWVESFVIAWKARYHLLQGEWFLAEEVFQQRHLHLDGVFTYPNVSEYLVFARSLITSGKFEDAFYLLQRLHERLMSIDWLNLALEVKLVWACALHTQGREDEALDMLAQALQQAEPEPYTRIFLDEGEPLQALLRTATHRQIVTPSMNTLFTDSNTDTAPQIHPTVPLSDPDTLSERELEVLRYLAKGLRNQEIADSLYISLNTVKTHLKHIHSKLDVNNRTEAVVRGRELGLV